MKPKVLMTLAEKVESTTPNHFAVKYEVDDEDCFDFAKGLDKLGHDVYFVNWNDFNGEEFNRMFHYNDSRFVPPQGLDNMDLIFAYKQEGFLFPENTDRFFNMLNRFERSPALVVNDPKTIKWNISKEYLFELERWGIDIIPTYALTNGGSEEIKQRLSNGERFILKPKIGERGNQQIFADNLRDLERIGKDYNNYLAQEFQPSIRDGERSLVYIGREFAHAAIKIPNPKDPKEFRCNESNGGVYNRYDPTGQELGFARNLLEVISERYPVSFSRVDLLDISGKLVLMEAELLNPSIYANLLRIGPEYGRKLARLFDEMIREKSSYVSSRRIAV